jgi:sterol 3beta-glucosyltransferase
MGRTVVMLAAGSRGDLQLCLALGRGLAARGDRVRIVASDRYAPLVAAAGLELGALGVDPAEILRTEQGQELLAGGRNPVKFLRNFKRILGPLAREALTDIRAAAKDADLLLSPTAGQLGHHLAEHLGVPWALMHFQPSEPTRAFPHPLVPQTRFLGGGGNRAGYLAVDQIAWQLFRPFLNPWRQEELGLDRLPVRGPMRRVRRDRTPVLCCFSEAVVPRPADWPPHVRITGYWFLDEPAYSPAAELAAFLAAGPPPVYVGFGSMVPPDPAAADRLIRAALRAAGARGVLQGDPATGEEDMFVVGDVPHSWLFPRTAAVVHHGGAGTTAAGLRSGVPSVVCPFFGDQPYWGERVAALGAGPAPVRFRELTVPRLADAIRQAVHDQGIRRAAATVGTRLRAEDGVGRAGELLARIRPAARRGSA